MKKLILGLFLIISFLASVSACQYKVNETYREVEMGLYDSSGNYVGEPLILSNFSGGYQNIAGCGPLSIIISNPLSFDINVEINFTARHDGIIGWPQEDYLISRALTIKAFSSEQIVGGCPSVGGSRLLEDSIEYVITSPKLLIPKMQEVEKQKEICKNCSNGKQCLDDGYLCSLNIECGSNFCNPDKRCGTFNGCSDGKKLCNQSNLCLTPSVKEVGEAYTCEWECKSDKYKNGICQKSSAQLQKEKEDRLKKLVIFGVIIFIIILLGYLYIEKRKRGRVKKEREDEEKKRDKAKEEYEYFIRKISDLEQKEILSKKKIDELNEIFEKQKREINEEISKLKKRRQNASQEAKREIDNELKKYDYKLIKIREEKNKEIEKERIAKEKLEVQREKYQKEIAEIDRTSPLREIERLTNEYVKDYQTGSRRIDFDKDEQRFMISSLYHSPEPLARFVYKKIDKNIGNKKVHHINYNQLIDEQWNLIALAQEQHEKIRHENLIKGDWGGGIKEIKRALNWQDSDFPEHIQKEIKSRKEQKRL